MFMRDVIEQLSYMSDNHGDNEAICYRNNMMTYKDLDIYSSKLATLLKDTSQPLVIYGHMSPFMIVGMIASRSEEHTSELQSRFDLVCRLLLEKKKSDLRSVAGVSRRTLLGLLSAHY